MQHNKSKWFKGSLSLSTLQQFGGIAISHSFLFYFFIIATDFIFTWLNNMQQMQSKVTWAGKHWVVLVTLCK